MAIGLAAWLAMALSHASAETPQDAESTAAMSEDVRKMHERLVALSEGEGSLSDLRIEFMDGGMSSHRSFDLRAGKLVSKEWRSPGASMIHREGNVTESRITTLLEQLIAHRYWTFSGTRFIPDAPIFLFRFYYRDVQYVDFRCDLDEVRKSHARSEVRDLFLKLVSETEMTPVHAP